MADEYLGVAVNTATNTTTVSAKPALVVGIYVNTVLSAHTVVLKVNTTAILTLPASLAAGTMLDIPATQFLTSLIVDPDDSSTGNITVFYRDLRA